MIWVDGGDPEWKAEKNKYNPKQDGTEDSRDSRYRDWDNLRYWFRGIEKFAPWVNKVYFVTCGHIPDWLNLDAPKLIHVKHNDYMPNEYLPTFNANPIELNLHRIKGLSEHFIYFNDDMFIIKPVNPDMYFKNGIPVHPARLHGIFPRAQGGVMPHMYINTATLINKNFNMKEGLKRDRKKWFSIRKNGIRNVIENIYNSNFPEYPGFGNEHMPVPILKSTMDAVWNAEGDALNATSLNKFRSMMDVNQYVFRYWQLASGNFIPIKEAKLGRCFDITPDTTEICSSIVAQKYNMVCLNDMDLFDTYEGFVKAREEIKLAFDKILPDKSAFEK